MKNILYYLKKFGHCTFEERPFSDVDSLILSAMSYMMFDGIVPALGEEKDAVGIGRLQSEFVLNRLVVNTMDPKLNRKLWRLLAACPRFKEMRLHYLRDVTDDGIIEQFAAVTCLLPGEGLHICFRGTDLTLLGWKEDFNMSYLDEVPAQAEAVRYVNEVTALTEGKIYIGGHSKGGNLAMYAAMNCQDSARERIAGVFNHDGPGFRTDVFNTESYAKLRECVHKIIPSDDMVGMLLIHAEEVKVVKCRGLVILQHDPYNWAIGKDGAFKSVSSKSAQSEFLGVTLSTWIESMQENRPRFVDLLFYILGADDGVTVVDYRAKPMHNVREAKKRFRALDEDSQAFFKDCFKQLIKYGKQNLRRLKKERKKERGKEAEESEN